MAQKLLDNPSKPISIWPIVIRYSVISLLIYVVYTTILYITDKHFSTVYVSFSLLIPVIVVFFAISNFKKANGSFISFKKGFLVGITFFLVFAILSWAFDYLYKNFIVPDYWDGFADAAVNTLEYFGMNDEQIEMYLEKAMRNKNNQWIQLVNTAGRIMFIGLIFSAIASAIFKKEVKE